MLERVSLSLQSLPDYIGEGLLELIITIAGGIIVGWVSATFLSKSSELTRVKGLLLEKKIPIYKELYNKLNDLNSLNEYTPANCKLALTIMSQCGFEKPKFLHLQSVFENPIKMNKHFLELDNYCAQNMIFFDDQVFKSIHIFQNYITIFNRFHTMFEEQMIENGINGTDDVRQVEHQMFIALGFILKDDFGEILLRTTQSIRESLNNLSFKHRIAPSYKYTDMMSADGALLSNILKTKVMIERDKINKLISSFVTIAIVRHSTMNI